MKDPRADWTLEDYKNYTEGLEKRFMVGLIALNDIIKRDFYELPERLQKPLQKNSYGVFAMIAMDAVRRMEEE